MPLSRRTFLAMSLSGLGALYGIYKWRLGDAGDVIIAILKRRIGYLQTEPGSLRTFADEYIAAQRDYESQLRALSMVALPLQVASPYAWLKPGRALRRLEDNVVSRYLLSTDFFQNGADEGQPVRYVAFYDPYAAPCRNPFARTP